MSDKPLPRVPERCMICDASWNGGCSLPGTPFKQKGVRAFYMCGASLSVIDRVKELGHEYDDGYCYFLRLKNCNGHDKEGQPPVSGK
jgi:hypothetical protein